MEYCLQYVLLALYAKQDELLKRIFGGEYGSTEENQLEELLDQHEELRNRIVEANFKWKQAQLMVDYAAKQLAEAVSKWTAVPNIDASRLEEKCVDCVAFSLPWQGLVFL